MDEDHVASVWRITAPEAVQVATKTRPAGLALPPMLVTDMTIVFRPGYNVPAVVMTVFQLGTPPTWLSTSLTPLTQSVP